MKYSLCILAALISTALFVVEAKRKPHENSKKFDGDFEFAGEVRVAVGRNIQCKRETSYIACGEIFSSSKTIDA